MNTAEPVLSGPVLSGYLYFVWGFGLQTKKNVAEYELSATAVLGRICKQRFSR